MIVASDREVDRSIEVIDRHLCERGKGGSRLQRAEETEVGVICRMIVRYRTIDAVVDNCDRRVGVLPLVVRVEVHDEGREQKHRRQQKGDEAVDGRMVGRSRHYREKGTGWGTKIRYPIVYGGYTTRLISRFPTTSISTSPRAAASIACPTATVVVARPSFGRRAMIGKRRV